MSTTTDNTPKDFDWLKSLSDRDLSLRIKYYSGKQKELYNQLRSSGIFDLNKSLMYSKEMSKALEESSRRLSDTIKHGKA